MGLPNGVRLENECPPWGHEDQFQPPRLNGGCRFGQGSFAEIYGSRRGDRTGRGPHYIGAVAMDVSPGTGSSFD